MYQDKVVGRLRSAVHIFLDFDGEVTNFAYRQSVFKQPVRFRDDTSIFQEFGMISYIT